MGQPAICRGYGAEVWPDDDEQPFRDCDNCGTRGWFKKWAKEKFGGSSVPRHATSGPTPVWEESNDSSSESGNNQTTFDASLEDFEQDIVFTRDVTAWVACWIEEVG